MLAEIHYPVTPTEKRTILPFFPRQLAAFGVRSEKECPVEDGDLANWVGTGLNYGWGILRDRPETVRQVFSEFTPQHLETLRSLASHLHTAAGGLNPVRLVEPLLQWHAEMNDWDEPTFYGRALARVIHLADFAVWLPWLLTKFNLK